MHDVVFCYTKFWAIFSHRSCIMNWYFSIFLALWNWQQNCKSLRTPWVPIFTSVAWLVWRPLDPPLFQFERLIKSPPPSVYFCWMSGIMMLHGYVIDILWTLFTSIRLYSCQSYAMNDPIVIITSYLSIIKWPMFHQHLTYISEQYN
jgi:hypothetical protein